MCGYKKITKEQFVDVVCQENGLQPGEIEIDFGELVSKKTLRVAQLSGYATCLHLGHHKAANWHDHSYPLFSFTCEAALEGVIGKYAPSQNYLLTISRGLSHVLSLESLLDYLKTKKGVEGNLSFEDLKNTCSILYIL